MKQKKINGKEKRILKQSNYKCMEAKHKNHKISYICKNESRDTQYIKYIYINCGHGNKMQCFVNVVRLNHELNELLQTQVVISKPSGNH